MPQFVRAFGSKRKAVVADTVDIKRLDGNGDVVQIYDPPGGDYWFALALDPNGTSFWAGDLIARIFYRFNIASGDIEVGPIDAKGGNQRPVYSVAGLCVKGEPNAASQPSDDEGPVTSDVTLTGSVVQVGAEVQLTATVDDTNTGGSDIYSAEYSIDGGAWVQMTPSDGAFDSPTEEVEADITASLTAGVYEVCVQGTDTADNTGAEECTFLVAYDPSGGFVTGGGWIDSEAGAYKPDPALAGKANFGFVSKYKKGATEPTGNTEFQFKVADLNFKSTRYEWLVITGEDSAKFKGEGTINGEGSYKFMLWGGDGTGTDGADTFRIRIWTEDETTGYESVVYDNKQEDGDQALAGGSIVVHTK